MNTFLIIIGYIFLISALAAYIGTMIIVFQAIILKNNIEKYDNAILILFIPILNILTCLRLIFDLIKDIFRKKSK
jgi:hypothetical protein